MFDTFLRMHSEVKIEIKLSVRLHDYIDVELSRYTVTDQDGRLTVPQRGSRSRRRKQQ